MKLRMRTTFKNSQGIIGAKKWQTGTEKGKIEKRIKIAKTVFLYI